MLLLILDESTMTLTCLPIRARTAPSSVTKSKACNHIQCDRNGAPFYTPRYTANLVQTPSRTSVFGTPRCYESLGDLRYLHDPKYVARLSYLILL
jgi:hypothetical protein